MRTISHDVVVVGGGLAGQMAALEALPHVDTAIISKVHPLRSHSVSAQGGINAPFGNVCEDDWNRHAYDTVKGSDFLADQDAVEVLCKEIMSRVVEMDSMGALFDRLEDKCLAQRPFGGGSFPRTCYAGDMTGHELMDTLFSQLVKERATVYSEWFVTSLLMEGGRCTGALALDIVTGELCLIKAKAVVLATGGCGRAFARTTNSHPCTGDGISIAFWAGATIADMEFVQFHPTTMIGTNILISEAARGEGGFLINSENERFMQRYAPKMMDLAPRDIVTRSIQMEIDEGRGAGDKKDHVMLDLTGLGQSAIRNRLPQIYKLALDFANVDVSTDPLPVQPAQHYTMGGIRTDLDGVSSVPCLLACGECACVSVHGANRLGGNSLAETLVFGKRAGTMASRIAEKGHFSTVDHKRITAEQNRIESIIDGGNESVTAIRSEMQRAMWDGVGIFRDKMRMMNSLNILKELRSRYSDIGIRDRSSRFNTELVQALELRFMLDCALMITMGAIAREESRGSHYRMDDPSRDDVHWLKHTLFKKEGEEIRTGYEPVRIVHFQPERRAY